MMSEVDIREDTLNIQNQMRKLQGHRDLETLSFGEKLNYMRLQEQYWTLMRVLGLMPRYRITQPEVDKK